MTPAAAAAVLAAELGCEVAPHPQLAGVVEARHPAPGLWLLAGTPGEIRAEVRAALLREWLAMLGTLALPLTPRELEVARLVAKGMKSREIAALLFISLRTVNTHLERVYRKTGTGSRVRLVLWLARV
jgi:DNA-binding CsgD family transcriptional regulator